MDKRSSDKSLRFDRLAEWLITAGGMMVIVTMLGIILLIAGVIVPLFISPSAEKMTNLPPALLADFDKSGQPANGFQRRMIGSGVVTATLAADNRISISRETVVTAVTGEEKLIRNSFLLDNRPPGQLSTIFISKNGERLYGGTVNGWLLRWDISSTGQGRLIEQLPAFADGRAITAIAMLKGDNSLAVGDSKGEITIWRGLNTPGSGEDKRFALIHKMPGHNGPVAGIRPSPSDKSLVSWDKNGRMQISYMTNKRLLLSVESGYPLTSAAFSENGKALITLGQNNEIAAWKLDIPHPEISWQVLFGAVQYEGYDTPEYIWQSSSASDDYEPKLSLVPLLFGTIKATLFAMLFAVPLALLGALYTSQFMSPRLKGGIKPVVEIMAAVPSVVVGFMAGLWFAPLLDRMILAVFISLLLVPTMIVITSVCWQRISEKPIGRRIKGYEFVLLIPLLVFSIWLSCQISIPLDNSFFGGDFKQWLYTALGLRYDQRNSIVIAIALGFAVIPIIFTIAEDALSNVPRNLSAASLALGASRWQTAWRVVLPSALPGVFAAVMIGFGRAVGETMIVLMATGNTPVTSWSPFNGLRSLAANIAVEVPEAPMNGTLYRLLFLSAVLLFILTFLINTTAELIRQHYRKKYGKY